MNVIVEDTLEWLTTAGIHPCVSKPELKQRIRDVRNWLVEELDEFEESVDKDDRAGMLNAVVDATWILHNLSYFASLTQEEINEEAELVRESNFSKFCKTREEAMESVKLYTEGFHPNKMNKTIATRFENTGNPEYPYVLLRVDDSKIQKSHLFKDVDVVRAEKMMENDIEFND